MKSKAAVRAKPSGYRWLRNGEVIRASDRYWIPVTKEWRRADYYYPQLGFVGDSVGQNCGDLDSQPWIRKEGKKNRKARQ